MATARILIVEDEFIVAEDLKEYLSELGYVAVGIAGDAATAERLAADTEPELILMDIKLRHGVDGIDAATAIQQHQDIPIVYVTAYADSTTLGRAKATAPAGYITKPVTPDNLRSSIEMALADASRRSGVIHVAEESTTALQRLFETREHAALVVDVAGKRIAAVNDRLSQLVGRTRRELLGRNVLTLANWTNREDLNTLLALLDEPGSVDTVTVRTDSGEPARVRCEVQQVTVEGDLYLLLDLLRT
jgi:PAS domain S-box-containing protein